MHTTAEIRKCRQDMPVVEAHFADGTTLRMSFYSRKGKPIETDNGRRLIRTITHGELTKSQHAGKNVDFFVFAHDGRAWTEDAEPAQSRPKRKPAAKTVLRNLLRYLDGDSTDHGIIDTARALAA